MSKDGISKETTQENGHTNISSNHEFSRRSFLKGAVTAAVVSTVGPFFLREVSAAQSDSWKIGFIAPLTGNLALGGNEVLRGQQIAMDMVNDEGGAQTLSGKKKLYFTKADAPDQTAAVNEMNRLIGNENVKLIMGSFSSAIAYVATPIAERRKVIFWETNAVVTDLTQRGFKYLFRTIAPAAQAGGDSAEFVAKFIAPKLGIAPKDFKVAIIWEDGTYGSSVGTGIREGARKNGLNIILDSSYNAKSTDLSPLVLKLKAANPDAIMCASIGSDAILLCKQMRDLDVNPKIIIGTSGGWCVPSLAPNIGKSINGIFSSDHPCMVGAKALTPEALALREEFLRRYGSTTATAHAWCGFVGAIALFKYVFPRIETLSPDEIRKAALSIDMPRGSLPNGYGLNFIPHDKPNGGQNAGAFCTIMQWLDDQLSVVYPESYAFRQPEFIPLPSWKERA